MDSIFKAEDRHLHQEEGRCFAGIRGNHVYPMDAGLRGVQLIGANSSKVCRGCHSAGGELRSAHARTYPHHRHESEDFWQTLVLGEENDGVTREVSEYHRVKVQTRVVYIRRATS